MRLWAAFGLLGLIWGSSFLLIRIGVEFVNPLHMVMIRVGIAAIGLSLVAIVKRKIFPRDWGTIRALIIIGIGNTVAPFIFITWGEISVESGTASVLQATTALFGLVVAHFAFKDERMTPQKVVGLLAGFVGVVILASRSSQDGEVVSNSLIGQLAIVLASLFYAIFTAYSRKVIQNKVEPIVLSAVALIAAAFADMVLIGGGILFFDLPATLPINTPLDIVIVVITLGLVHTFIAYLIYYEIVRGLGVSRATMVTYVIPPVGLILGVIFLSEPLDLKIILGAGLIFSGIAIANMKRFQRKSSRTSGYSSELI